MKKRTAREQNFKRSVIRALTKSKATTRALTRLLKYDIPRGPKAPRSIQVWTGTANDIAFMLKYYIADGNPASEGAKKSAAQQVARIYKKLGRRP